MVCTIADRQALRMIAMACDCERSYLRWMTIILSCCDLQSLSFNEQLCLFFRQKKLGPNVRQKVKFTRQRAYNRKKGKTEKKTWTYGHIRPSSFGMLLSFYGRHLWSSPVGLGFSTRLAQAADSLSGERILTPPSASMLCVCGRLVCVVTLQAGLLPVRALERCWRDCCRCQNPSPPCTALPSRHSSLLSRGLRGCCLCPPSPQSTCHPSLRAVSRGTEALAMRCANGR